MVAAKSDRVHAALAAQFQDKTTLLREYLALLDGAMAHLVCVPHAQLDGGDHTIFVGRVVDGSVAGAGADPLLYFRGAYRGIAPA